MAVSGSFDYAATRDDLITEAMEQLGVLGDGESPSANDLTTCARTLNYMLKAWQAKNINLFAVQKLYLFLQEDKVEYSLSSSGDHLTSSFVQTALSSAASSTDTTIDVDSITGISDGDYIMVAVDDGTAHWTTVNGTPSGSTITLTDALDDDAAVDSVVYAYTNKANRPMKLLNAQVKDKDGNETDINIEPRERYVTLPNKTSEGQVNQIYYDPQITTGKLYTWPESDIVTDYLVLYVLRTLDDLDSAAQDVAFPQEWFLALALNLAVLIAPKYGAVSRETMGLLRNNAVEALEDAVSFDTEDYLKIEPEIQ